MVYFPTSSPVYLIEFELIAFKNALAKSSSKGKTVLLFPNGLDPIINRLIRFMASRMHLDSMLISDFRSEVVVVYPESYFREEHQRDDGLYTSEDFLLERSLGLLDCSKADDQEKVLELPFTQMAVVKPTIPSTDNFELRSKADEVAISAGECSSTTNELEEEPTMVSSEAVETSTEGLQYSQAIKHDCLLLSHEVMEVLIPCFPNMFSDYIEGSVNFNIKKDLEMSLPVNVYLMTVKEKSISPSDQPELEEDDED